MEKVCDRAITVCNENEILRIEAWGRGLRVRSTILPELPDRDWALDVPVSDYEVESGEDWIECEGIRCDIKEGRLIFSHNGKTVLEEKSYPWAVHKTARDYRFVNMADSFQAKLRFEPQDEILHGMGQYRDSVYDLKGTMLELAPRNSQISIPFVLSSAGYGFLWNNPAIGEASFGGNVTEWKAEATKCIDYWITAADTPAEMIERYTEVTGHASPISEDLLGLWQCKLRYRTQDEVLEVAREYKRRGIKLDVIVIDFFHWDYQGDWSFDPEYWPDPQAMVDELAEMGTKVMVSVWPTIDPRSENFEELKKRGFLIRTDRGINAAMDFFGKMYFFDSTNPEAREFGYKILKKNYGQYGIDMFWLDEAEPEYTVNHYDHYRQYIGPVAETGNFYSRQHARMLYDGQTGDGMKEPLNLIRCAWVGSSRFGALVWSGDVQSTFREMKHQLINGINMGVAGIPWWISDTGGFYDGFVDNEEFRELLIRWYQWACFTPVLRMHGDRLPHVPDLATNTDHGGGFCFCGAPNELWSYGEEVYEILHKYLGIRENMKEYIRKSMEETISTGLPLIRAMFIEYPEDDECWKIPDEYMFGSKYLVAPVTDFGARSRKVYLPAGDWKACDTGNIIHSTGEYVDADAPLDYMPVYESVGTEVK